MKATVNKFNRLHRQLTLAQHADKEVTELQAKNLALKLQVVRLQERLLHMEQQCPACLVK